MTRRRSTAGCIATGIVVAVLALAGAPAPTLGQSSAEPAPSTPDADSPEIVEEVERSIVQIDVTVLGEDAESLTSVPGFEIDDFELEIDGEPLGDEKLREASFDVIEVRPDDPATSEAHKIVMLVDLNFVSVRSKVRLADMLRELALRIKKFPGLFKVVVFTSFLDDLTDGFTRDPSVLRAAADRLENQSWIPRWYSPGQIGDLDRRQRSPLGGGSGRGRLTRFEPPGTPIRSVDTAQLEAILRRMNFDLTEEELLDFPAEALDPLRASASGRALESVLLSHFELSGRKILLLFSSSSANYLVPWEGRAILQQGISVWPIEAGSINLFTGRRSLERLATESGGIYLGRVGRGLSLFERVRESLARYYLVSLPIEEAGEKNEVRTLEVRLKDEDREEEVVAPRFITLLGRRSRLWGKHIHASLSLDPPRQLAVASSIFYPEGRGYRRRVPVRFWMRLGDLRWEPADDDLYRASMLLDAVVIRHGQDRIEFPCGIMRSDESTEMLLPRPPAESSRQGLVLELDCPYLGEGVFEARATVTDVQSGRIGVGTSRAFLRTTSTRQWEAFAPVIEIATGEDLIINATWDQAVRDRERVAWRPAAGEAIRAEDRIALRYVLCGPDSEDVRGGVTHLVLGEDETGAFREVARVSGKELEFSPRRERGSFCESVRAVVDPLSLETGRYAFVALPPGEDPEDALAALDSGRGSIAGSFSPLVFLSLEVE